MAPTKFQIFVDESIRPATTNASSGGTNPIQPGPAITDKGDTKTSKSRFYFDERTVVPPTGGELSFEEINYACWVKRQMQLAERKRVEDLCKENEELRQQIEALNYQLNALKNKQAAPRSPTITNRLSIVPQSLQPTQGLEYNDMSYYGAINDAPSVVQDLWKNTFAHDKFTVPIDQSQWFKDNVPCSTPASKKTTNPSENDAKRAQLNNRRLSRPSMGGSPTFKLSPITETSRDCNSKSSSSSSAMSGTPGTSKKTEPPVLEPVAIDEPEKPLNPNDPNTYRILLRNLPEPLERRSGYHRLNRSVPKIRQGACFKAGSDNYLVDKELSHEAKTFTAQLLTDDSNDSNDMPIKTVCFRVDQPANEWLYYICHELHRRIVKQRIKPDIELSVMIANPAVMYNDGSILVDEYFRFVSLQNLFDACIELNKPFPKSVAAYITLELIQLVRQIHTCDMIHMNINPNNVLIICCPTREDIAKVDERTSIVKLIGFDRAMDMRLLPTDFKFDSRLEDLVTCEMMDSKPWSYEVDWFGILNCIYQMFFLEDMRINKEEGKWAVEKQFKGFPTNIWCSLFEALLNITDIKSSLNNVDEAIDELNIWIKANISFVLKEADSLDRTYEEYCKLNNKSTRI